MLQSWPEVVKTTSKMNTALHPAYYKHDQIMLQNTEVPFITSLKCFKINLWPTNNQKKKPSFPTLKK